MKRHKSFQIPPASRHFSSALLVAVFVSLFLSACKKNTESSPILDDIGVAIGTMGTQLREISDSVIDPNSTKKEFGLSSVFTTPKKSPKRCETSGNVVIVKTSLPNDRETIESYSHEDFKLILTCNEKTGDADINWRQREIVNGLHVARTEQYNNPSRNVTVAEFDWHWIFENGHNIAERITRGDLSGRDLGNGVRDEGKFTVNAKKPLRQRYILDSSSNEIEREYVSGEAIAIFKNDMRLTWNFVNLKLDPAQNCQLKSGKILGVVEKSGKKTDIEILAANGKTKITVNGVEDTKASSDFALTSCTSPFTPP